MYSSILYIRKQTNGGIKMRDYLEIYVGQLKFAEKADNTIKAYREDIEQMLSITNKEVTEITPIDLMDYCQEISVLADTSKIRKINCVKAFFTWLNESQIIDTNPAKSLITPKLKEKEVRFTPNEQQVSKMISRATNAKMKAILSTLASTGLRFSELKNIKLSDVTDGQQVVTDALTVRGKGSKSRTVYLNKDAVNMINEYLKVRKEGCDNLFSSDQGTPLDNASLLRSLKTLAKKCEIEQWSECEPHSFRRFFITSLWNKGVNPSVICSLTGHSSLDVEMKHYIKVDENEKRMAIQ